MAARSGRPRLTDSPLSARASSWLTAEVWGLEGTGTKGVQRGHRGRGRRPELSAVRSDVGGGGQGADTSMDSEGVGCGVE